MPISQLICAFNAGELSPYLNARSDIEKYTSGCQTLENFVTLPYGGVYRRAGTEHLAGAKNNDSKSRLIGFNFSTSTNYMIEVGNLYMRFFRSDGTPVLDGMAPLEVVTPYAAADIQPIQYIQINDVMYFAHPSYPTQKLSRIADDDWLFEEVVWDWPTLLDENVENILIAPSATTGTAITLTASATAWVTSTAYKKDAIVQSTLIYRAKVAHTSAAAFATDLAAGKWELVEVFTSGNVGGYFQIGHLRPDNYVEKAITANGSSPTIIVLGDWEFTTTGTWAANIYIERSYDNGTTWEIIRSYDSNSDKNYSSTGNEETTCLLRIRVSAYISGSGRARLAAQEAKVYGIVQVTAVATSISATADVIKDLFATTATKFWSEGAWSTRRGFPRAIALHEQRVYYGGTSYRALSIWGSVIDDFQNFRVSSNDDAGLFFSLSSQESNPIQWMTSQDQLLIGTAGEEWTLGATDSGLPITPTSVRAVRQSSYGSKYLRAMVVNDVILFVQRQGRKVRELVYQFEKDGWVAPDLTVLAEQVTSGEILEVAFQQQPDAIYWAVTGGGQLIGMTYEREQNVVGWHRHITDGFFESVATIYGANGPDQVWFVIRRAVDGVTVRYIERFKVDFRAQFEAQNKEGWWYLDSAKRFIVSGSQQTFSGLDHLEGKTVDILSDGAVSPARVVAGGEITLQAAAHDSVLVGLQYVSTLTPMPLEMQMQNGSTKGKEKKAFRATVSVYKSLGGEIKANKTDHWDKIYSRIVTDPMDSSPPTFTGDKDIPVTGDFSRQTNISLRQSQPLPLTILAITPSWEPTGT